MVSVGYEVSFAGVTTETLWYVNIERYNKISLNESPGQYLLKYFAAGKLARKSHLAY